MKENRRLRTCLTQLNCSVIRLQQWSHCYLLLKHWAGTPHYLFFLPQIANSTEGQGAIPMPLHIAILPTPTTTTTTIMILPGMEPKGRQYCFQLCESPEEILTSTATHPISIFPDLPGSRIQSITENFRPDLLRFSQISTLEQMSVST